MQITVRQAANYLGVDESTLRRWIRQRGLPVHRANERLYLNAIEVWEWAVEQGVPASRGLLEEARRSPEEVPPLSTLLEAGGVHRDVEGDDKSAVLAAIVKRLPLSPEVDREFLLTVLDAREAMGSTGIGDGIAIPHVRNPILLHVDQPFVSLCLLRRAVEFGAIDGKPVHAVFLVVSPSVPSHLKILARLGFVLRDPELRDLLARRAPTGELLDRIRAIEDRSTGSFPVPGTTRR
jgi:PTS system nitrogen regulatory IIA component